jgi:hypothetical protein
MPRMTKAQFDKIKAAAPDVPPDTCPLIDFVIDRLDDIPQKNGFEAAQIEAMKAILEAIRTANETLRSSSYYWYREWQKGKGQ